MREHTKKPKNRSLTLDHNTGVLGQTPISDILQAYENAAFKRQSVQDRMQGQTSGQSSVGIILQRYKEKIQGYTVEEDEALIQGAFEFVQPMEMDKDELLQSKPESVPITKQADEKPNNTGLSNNLKAALENISSYSMDDVRVHYNSDKPTRLNAFAYTQGTDIHIAPGQEKHLPHEAWHIVQQKQGRVQSTMRLGGVNVNDNEELEKEADAMGGIIVRQKKHFQFSGTSDHFKTGNDSVVQRVCKTNVELKELTVNEFDKHRKAEQMDWANAVGFTVGEREVIWSLLEWGSGGLASIKISHIINKNFIDNTND